MARVLRRAGRQLAVLNVSGRQLTCAAFQPLRDCSGLERLSLTGCACVDARALGRDVLPPGEGYLASLSVDGIDSLDEESVGRLQSLVRGSQLDVTECDVCETFVVCKACADDCGVQICSEDAEDLLTCDACKRFWCENCEPDMATCDGCHVSKCQDCANTGGAFMVTCADCFTTTCDNCMCDAGRFMHCCAACYACMCEKCAFVGADHFMWCKNGDLTRCMKCAFDGALHLCESCYDCTCMDCMSKKPCCSAGARSAPVAPSARRRH